MLLGSIWESATSLCMDNTNSTVISFSSILIVSVDKMVKHMLKFFRNTRHYMVKELIHLKPLSQPAFIYLLKVDNRNTRTRCEICSKLTIKIPERRQWRRSGVFIVNFEHISHLIVVFLLLTLNIQLPAGNA